MTPSSNCQSCGLPLSTNSTDGLCPACMLRLALEPDGDEAVEGAGPPSALPRTFGPYELIEEIGRGGMGVVYAARQPALGRTVAVKLLLAGAFASETALRRFQLEAAAAAILQHPNIVAIHDCGEVDGQPYYAMDLVTGRNLAELCAGRPLPAQRAAEFLRLLAGAVHYAHQHGILHRDLKPANVLVDEAARPRITDFGLAKMLGSTEGGTLTGQMLGSPGYASTEQVAGRDAEITAASDVYGLGALFYHLVTGHAPFNAATPAETVRLVLDTDPPPPRLLNPSLPRDLETICLKCLEKEPVRRYASAADLAGDVERFLGERPIRARPPGVLYRTGKFARRHRAGVAATGIAMVALATGLVLSLAGYRRAVVQRRAADAARGQAGQLVDLMSHELTPVVEQRGALPQLVKMTEATVRYYETLPSELRSTRTDQAQADALAALARLQWRSLNDFKGAEAALQAALALREKVARDNPDDPEAAAAWLSDASEMPRANYDPAVTFSEARWEEIFLRGRELHRRFPDNLHVKQCFVDLLVGYANAAQLDFDKPREAAAAAAEGQQIVEELLAAQRKGQAPPELIGRNLCALAYFRIHCGELSRASAASEQALAHCTEALTADPGNLKLRDQTAEAARTVCYTNTTFFPRNLEAARIAREHLRVLSELNPNDQVVRFRFAFTRMQECWHLYQHAPDFATVRKAFREYHALLDPFLGRKGYFDTFLWGRINEHIWLAVLAASSGEPADARREIDGAQLRFADYCRRLPEGSFEQRYARVRFLTWKEYVFYRLRDWPAMAETARDCLAEIEAGLKQRPVDGPLLLRQAEANAFLAIAAQREGRPGEAIARLPPAIEVMRAAPRRYYHLGTTASMQLPAEKALTEAFVQQGDRQRARLAAEQLLLDHGFGQMADLGRGDGEAGDLTLAASLCNPAEAVRCIGLADRAKTFLTSPAAIGRLTVDGRENLGIIARLRAEAAANLSPEALDRTGRQLDAATSTDPAASEPFTRAGEVTWNLLPVSSAISSPDAREAELAARDCYRSLMERYPENGAYRFLFAETHRMECYVHFGWDGQVEAARAAFREYDELLEPFVGRKGYDSVLRTRLANSLHLAHLGASVGDKADAARWLEEARKRYEAYRERLPEGSPERGLARVRFLEESAWSAWWLRDWPELARLAEQAQVECEAGLKVQPASGELMRRRMMADGFAALALAGTAQGPAVATRLQAMRDRMESTPSVYGIWDDHAFKWAIFNARTEALRDGADRAQFRRSADGYQRYLATWVPGYPEYWRAQVQLAVARLRVAGFLDPAAPFEAALRQKLLDLAAPTLAPDNVAGRLTVDVREALRELDRLRAAPPPPAR